MIEVTRVLLDERACDAMGVDDLQSSLHWNLSHSSLMSLSPTMPLIQLQWNVCSPLVIATCGQLSHACLCRKTPQHALNPATALLLKAPASP